MQVRQCREQGSIRPDAATPPQPRTPPHAAAAHAPTPGGQLEQLPEQRLRQRQLQQPVERLETTSEAAESGGRPGREAAEADDALPAAEEEGRVEQEQEQ